jgi:hypothetical protein
MKMALGSALASNLASTRYGLSKVRRRAAFLSPMEIQVSVTTQSAPATARSGSWMNSISAPDSRAHFRRFGGGANSAGVAMRRVKSNRAAA